MARFHVERNICIDTKEKAEAVFGTLGAEGVIVESVNPTPGVYRPRYGTSGSNLMNSRHSDHFL